MRNAVLQYHFALDIAVFVNISSSQWRVSQQSIAELRRQNFEGLQILKT